MTSTRPSRSVTAAVPLRGCAIGATAVQAFVRGSKPPRSRHRRPQQRPAVGQRGGGRVQALGSVIGPVCDQTRSVAPAFAVVRASRKAVSAKVRLSIAGH